MSKITFAGVSRTAGVLRFRTASDDKRFAQLAKLGDTDIEFTRVSADTKSQAAKELLGRNFANGRADIDALLVGVAKDDNTIKPKRQVTVRVPTRFAIEQQGKKVTVEKKLSIEEANARAVASMREVTEAEALERLCFRVAKKRKSRKTVEVV